MQNLLIGFKQDLEGLGKNDILIKKEDRNDVICQMIIDQVAENKRFELPEKPFGDQTCPKCNGIGQKILFERELSVRTCLKCKDGKKEVPCNKPNCQNGRFIKDKGDLRINVKCKFCHGTKVRTVRCRTCRGKGELHKMVITPKIKSTTPCKHCRELGFIDETLFTIIDDVAKFENDAEILTAALFSETEENADVSTDQTQD